ncbi:PREDICTED: G protein-activated inward rectifier potassium channel 3-like [Nicrophorus vespilloides]|uniref:G protein-activated inward rectifier potassium channel 3-like n=1 Tax=Nicrophorus vespilloides TaxID=110193 RepID=A0ABM1NFJ0_NICVS|nr:PREDICTED: G protein-activated inward rectifier potassium channel 3-like [Nicrophorus vespilloides]XP_017785589.1 PREDICTED: G protein-activated inward rectifier potassium channel 3-like [Nicrophorus vespilloides]XP_017785590.1 PREDICTED: G protein-activated inward rectifier potassium channel 3-like [Nicrophorus vespilloides]
MVEDAACLEEGKGHGDGDVPAAAAADSQWEKLLGNGRVPVPLPASATIPVPVQPERRRSSVGSLFSSFRRSFRFTTGGAKGAGGGASTGHVFSRYRQSRFNARRIRKRVVFKHGDCNVVQGNVAKRSTRYLQDIFTTLVDAQWRWTLFVFSMNFLLSWLAFAVVWWFISFTHGDLVPQNFSNSSWTPCVTNIRDFTSCFLFSVETQHTIGYGNRTPTEACPEAIFFLCLQSITGVMIQAFMVGIVFAKLSRPKKRTQTLLFSRHAVICQRDGTLCLMFRVGDMRKSHIIEAHVRAQLIRHKVTKEGESLPFYQTELKVGGDGEEDKIFFIWPTTIVHKIDKTSPLYQLSATDLLRERFEIVVILEGVIESTGMTTQARSSYLPSEILWGHRFQTLVSFKSLNGEYEVDYALFNNTVEVDTPLSSAKQLDEFGIVEQQMSYDFSNRSPSSNTLCSMDSMSIDLSLADGGLHLHQHHNHLHHENHFQIGGGNLHCSSSSPNTDSTAILLSRNSGTSSFGRRMSAPHNHTTVAV